jgi:hypothetical protein
MGREPRYLGCYERHPNQTLRAPVQPSHLK